MEDDKQSLQFFKIKLMEKQSQLKTLQAKLKKIQFKHSRDLKQIKISQQRAKELLKKEKTKLDKITQQAKKHQQQNTLLQHRLNQLKQQKDKEIQNTRNKYNTIKQQVRSYQRILPTHTFLTQIGAEIDQLPTYQDIFNNLKEKVLGFDNLTTKYQQFKQEMEEKISLMQKNQEQLTKKMAQKQKMVKQMLPKVVDLQSQVSEYKYQLQDAASKIIDTEEEVLTLRHKIQELQSQTKDLKNQIQDIISAHNTQLQNKQLQIRQLTDSQFKRYQDEISELNTRSEMKQQSYMQQINIYQEQVHELQGRLQKQKQRHQQNYQEIKQIMQNLKATLQSDKRTIGELQQKNAQLNRCLFESTNAIQKLQFQLQDLKKDKEQTQHQLRQSQSQRDLDNSELNQKDLAKRQLEYKIDELIVQLNRTTEQKKVRQEQNVSLLSEIEQLRYKIENGSSANTSVRLSIPHNIDMEDQPIRRRRTTNFSIVEDTVHTVIEGFKHQQKLQVDSIERISEYQSRSRRPSVAISEKYNQIKILRTKNQQLQAQIQIKIKELNTYSEKNVLLQLKLNQFQQKIQSMNRLIITTSESLKNTENRENKQKQELSELNKMIKQLQVQIQDLTSNEATLKKKQEVSKTTIQTLTGQNTTLKADLKKQKQQKQVLTQQIKQIKAKQFEDLTNNDKTGKQFSQKIKELNNKILLQEQSKGDLLTKQKTYQTDINAYKLQIQKLNNKITQIEKQITASSEKIQQAQKINKELKKSNQRLKYQVDQLQQDNKQKDRQIQMINDSLERERKQRTLITVPSLQSLQADVQTQEQQNFKQHYNTIGQKEGQIYMLQREVSNLKQEVEEMKLTHKTKIQDMQTQQNEYIQQIIVMKLKVAESEMKAAQKEHLYNQLKKKLKTVQNSLKQSSSPSNSSK